MLCLCALFSVLSCVLCAIHSFVNRENVQFAPHLSRSLCLFLSFSLSFALNLAVCMCACTQRAAIILWIFIYVFFSHSDKPSKCWRRRTKNVKVEKKRSNAHSNTLNVCTWCGPLRHFILAQGACSRYFQSSHLNSFLFSSLTNCELFEMKKTFIHHCITMHFKSKCSSGSSSSHSTGNYSIYYYFERLFISIFNIERIESTKNWINK